MVDQEGTPGVHICYQELYHICCVSDDADAGSARPPLVGDMEIVERIDSGHCPTSVEADALHGAQSNQFLRSGGPMQQLFRVEYFRFFQEMMRKPEYQACAVADAAAVLLHPDSGVM